MKHTLNFTVFLFWGAQLFAQSPKIDYGSNKVDTSYFIQYIPVKSDFVLAFSKESYWWSNIENFKLLTRKGKKWTTWTYKRKWKSSSDVLNNKGKKKKKYFTRITTVDSLAVNELFDNWRSIKFSELHLDSLNSTRGYEIFDAVNDKFNIETVFGNRLIESYAPEYYIQKFPDMYERALFIQGRDIFLQWWKKYSR